MYIDGCCCLEKIWLTMSNNVEPSGNIHDDITQRGLVYHLFVMQGHVAKSMTVGKRGQKKSKFVWRHLWMILLCKFVLENLPILARNKKVIFVKIDQEKKKCNFSNMGNIGLPKITFVKRKLKQKLTLVNFLTSFIIVHSEMCHIFVITICFILCNNL